MAQDHMLPPPPPSSHASIGLLRQPLDSDRHPAAHTVTPATRLMTRCGHRHHCRIPLITPLATLYHETCSCCCCWLLKWPLLLAAVIAAGSEGPQGQAACVNKESHSCTGWLPGLQLWALGTV